MNQYIEHNILHVDPDVPEGSTLIHLGTPCHTTCPYDTYARYIANDARKFFNRPTTVVGKLHYTAGAWRTGGSWPFVCQNALALAAALGKDAPVIERLTAYATRHPITP